MNIKAILLEKGLPKHVLKKLWIRRFGPCVYYEIHYEKFNNLDEINVIQKMLRGHFSFILKENFEGNTFFLRAWP